MSKQSIGVDPFKGLIRWLYPEAVAAFDACAAQHDKDYKTVDWSIGADATREIDDRFYLCCLTVAAGDIDLQQDAHLFYRVARKWGIMRAYLWKIGVRY